MRDESERNTDKDMARDNKMESEEEEEDVFTQSSMSGNQKPSASIGCHGNPLLQGTVEGQR